MKPPTSARRGFWRFPLLLSAFASFGLASCGNAPEGWTPVLEQTSSSYLHAEVRRTLVRVTAARQRVRSDPSDAIDLLDTAERGLRSLKDVYIPLLDARARAYNAYRHHYLGRDAEVARELEQIEESLVEVAGRVDGSVLAEVEHIQEFVGDARLEVQSGSSEVTAALRRLAEELEMAVAKADLFL